MHGDILIGIFGCDYSIKGYNASKAPVQIAARICAGIYFFITLCCRNDITRHLMHSRRAIYIYIRLLCIMVSMAVPGLAHSVETQKRFTVTLDAGHGGKDTGALGKTAKEKNITLSVVRQLGELIESRIPDVNVVYTRKTDDFIELFERAAIANHAGSDLFISVHVNSVDRRNRNRSSVTGCQVYTLGLHKTAENLAVAKRENAVVELEPDHTERYAGFDPNSLESDIVFELSQTRRLDQSIEFADEVHRQLVDVAGRQPKGVRQAGLLVLWATSMPSVLVELDFICNPDAEKYLVSDDGQKEMVTAIYNAFCAYYNTYAPQITGRQLSPAQAIELSREHPSESKDKQEISFVDVEQEKFRGEASEVKPDEESVDEGKLLKGVPGVASDTKSELFYVQILATDEPIAAKSSEFKQLDNIEYYTDSGMYKYVVGVARNESEAKKLLKKVRRSFPQAFIVKMQGGRRVSFIKP